MFSGISFAYSWVLYFLLVIPLLIVWYIWQGRKKQAAIKYSSLKIFAKIPATFKERLRHLPFALRMIALIFLIVALARPQNFSAGQNVNAEGIDIAMVLDISGSMMAEDFKPNRLEAAKDVIDNFIKGRTTDRIGLVIFSREAFTQCPLTIDYSVLRNLLADIKTGMIEDGTAIGNGIANGVNRLKDSDAKSKVIILLTDGVNNAGEVDPISAAEIAAKFGIRIYTIGVGTRGEAPYPVQTPFGTRYQMMPVEIDEALLKKISDLTGGQYFRATNNRALEEIYNKIDKMEKTKIEITSYKNAKELYAGWLEIGFLFLLLELVASRTILRKLP
ncbi:MAG TPA: VWA domain-containing protein [Ignavibacteriaceae bacterium]|mgnify:CR=1 FL=1|nr:VWA domain-containing protein [Ignavibacteriaceae bacterium]